MQIDSKTGKETPIWNAADQLTAQVTKTVATPEPWFTNRKVVTRDETGKPQPFLWDKLPNLQDSLAPGKPARGKALVAYLRGSSENEGTEAASSGRATKCSATSSTRRRPTSARRTPVQRDLRRGLPGVQGVGSRRR